MPDLSVATDNVSGGKWELVNGIERSFIGSCRKMCLPSGIDMMNFEFSCIRKSDNVIKIEDSPVTFAFHLMGAGEAELIGTASGSNMNSAPGRTFVAFMPDSRWRVKTLTGQYYKTFNLYVSPENLRNMLDGGLDCFPVQFRKMLDGNSKEPFCYHSDMSHAVKTILEQIAGCPYQGVFRRMFMEQKSSELIMRQLWDIFCCVSGDGVAAYRIDEDSIREARQILTSEIENPPSLPELAKRVGINVTKLKKGFRQVFNDTPYGFVRSERLKTARIMLVEGRMNITEISFRLGFSDTSHFIREFSKYYGITPGRFVKTSV